MEQTNLAAAILQCAGARQVERCDRLTNEEAIKLVDWLQYESPMSAWRNISLPSTFEASTHPVLGQGVRRRRGDGD
jgi:hypothetical protein